MAYYYSTDWVTPAPVVTRSRHVPIGPAIGATLGILGLLVLLSVLFPVGGGAVEDAVAYVDTGAGWGSGMVINTRYGYVLTNRHVVEDETTGSFRADTFKLIFNRGTDHERQVDAIIKEVCKEPHSPDANTEMDHDWAVLEIKGEQPRTAVHFGDSMVLKRGVNVTAWGFPVNGADGKTVSQTPGTVTLLDQKSPGASYPIIEHGAKLTHGNSGGPLTLTEGGAVIGMNVVGDIAANGAYYSIPSHILKPVLDKYAQYTYH